MARKSAGPKKLQEVRVNPAIASAFAGAKLAPPPAAASSPTKPAAASPAPAVKLAPPPAPRPAQSAQPAPPSPTSPAALAEALGGPTQPPTIAAVASPSAARSSGAASPWSAASPSSAKHGAEFDAFGAFGSASAGESGRGLSCTKVTGCLLACPCKSARQPSYRINCYRCPICRLPQAGPDQAWRQPCGRDQPDGQRCCWWRSPLHRRACPPGIPILGAHPGGLQRCHQLGQPCFCGAAGCDTQRC